MKDTGKNSHKFQKGALKKYTNKFPPKKTPSKTFQPHTNRDTRALYKTNLTSGTTSKAPPKKVFKLRDAAGPKCFACGKQGHVVRDCPDTAAKSAWI